MAKPSCSNFIVAAIRHLRPKYKDPKKGKAGTSIRFIWRAASELYSEAAFRKVVNQLLGDGTLVATWDVAQVLVLKGVGDQPNFHRKPYQVQRLSSIPDKMPLDDKWSYRYQDDFIRSDQRSEHAEYEDIRNLRLYVAGDGLPLKVPGKKQSVSTVVRDILASMRQPPK